MADTPLLSDIADTDTENPNPTAPDSDTENPNPTAPDSDTENPNPTAPEAPAANGRWVMDWLMDLIRAGDVLFSYVGNIVTIIYSPGRLSVGIPLLCVLSILAFMWTCCIRCVRREVGQDSPAPEVFENIIDMPALDTDLTRDTDPASGTGPATRTGTDNEENIIDIHGKPRNKG